LVFDPLVGRPPKEKKMADHDTIIARGGGDNGASLVVGSVLAVAPVLGALRLFNKGFIGNDLGSSVKVNTPANGPAK